MTVRAYTKALALLAVPAPSYPAALYERAVFCMRIMELASGLEPETHSLQGNCATDCAMQANSVYALALTQTLIEYAFADVG